MPFVLLKQDVTFCGSIVEAGETLELSESNAKSLVEESMAEYIDEITPAVADDLDETVDGSIKGIDEENDDLKNDFEASEEDLAKVRKTLDDKYKRDDLAKEAKELGVEFAYNAKKDEIIEAVIAADKAQVLLQA